jgi:uncharacterized protein Yka (UPF0111/DUF47 family)
MKPINNENEPPAPSATPKADAAYLASLQWHAKHGHEKTTDERLDTVVNDPRPATGWQTAREIETELSTALARAEQAEREREQWEKDYKCAQDRYESFIVWVSSAAFKALGKYRDGHVCDYRNAVQSIADKVERHTWAQEEVSELNSLRSDRDDLHRQLAEAKARNEVEIPVWQARAETYKQACDEAKVVRDAAYKEAELARKKMGELQKIVDCANHYVPELLKNAHALQEADREIERLRIVNSTLDESEEVEQLKGRLTAVMEAGEQLESALHGRTHPTRALAAWSAAKQ